MYKRLIVSFGAVALILYGAYLALDWQQKQRMLHLLPAALDVDEILYSKEQSWGFGPGANETGIIVYELPSHVSEQIQRTGIRYFEHLGPSAERAWRSSPQQIEGLDLNADKAMAYDISTFLNRYGFGIDLDPDVERQTNSALSKQGSFIAGGGSVVLIVAPKIRRVIYAYRG